MNPETNKMTSLKFEKPKIIKPEQIRDCCGSISINIIQCSACMSVICGECANYVYMCQIAYCDSCYVEEEREPMYNTLYCGHCRNERKNITFHECPSGNPVCKSYCGCGNKCYLHSAIGQTIKRSNYKDREKYIGQVDDSPLIKKMNHRERYQLIAKQRRSYIKKRKKVNCPAVDAVISEGKSGLREHKEPQTNLDVPDLEKHSIDWVIDVWTCDVPQSLSRVKLKCTMCDKAQILRVLNCHPLHVALCPKHKYWMQEYNFYHDH